MNKINAILIFAIGLIVAINCQEYYWREYNGSIPDDALIAGEDVRGKVYIGQGLCPSGVYPGAITKGKLTLEIPCRGDHSVNATYIKILCSNFPDNFYWLPTNRTTYFKDTSGKNPVIGGFSSVDILEDGINHIGRTTYKDIVNIGYTDRYSFLVDIYFIFPGKANPIQLNTDYQILIYGIAP